MRRFELSIVAALSAACGQSAVCTSPALEAALAGAASGDTVEVGSCRIEGNFTVPAGVTLAGLEESASVISGSTGAIVTLSEGATLASITVESAGAAGVLAAASATVRQATVRASKGVGIGVDRAPAVTLESVEILGPVTAANAAGVPGEPAALDTATHGLVIAGVADATLKAVQISGFASFGALLAGSTTRWTDGGVTDTLGTALMVEGGAANLDGLTLCRMLQGVRLIPPYGAVFSAKANVQTMRVEVCDSEGFGLLHDDSVAKHTDLAGVDNSAAAVWLQNVTGFEMTGSLERNGFAGLVAVRSSGLTIRDTRVSQTRKRVRIFDQRMTVEVGDGLQLVGTSQNVKLERVSASGNERVGVLFDLEGAVMEAGSVAGLELKDTPSDALGIISQNGTTPMGWDDAVQRDPIALANDSAFAATLTIVGVVGPCHPAITNFGTAGIGALLGN